MTPEELQRIGIRMYGRKHWRRDLAINLGMDVSTVWRISKRLAVPAVVEVAIRGLLEKHKVIVKAQKQLREQRQRDRHRYKGKSTVSRRRTNDLQNDSRAQGVVDGPLEGTPASASGDVES